MPRHAITPILPCNDVAASLAFYNSVGFYEAPDVAGKYDGYLILVDGSGAELHLTNATEGWLIPGRNPFAIYIFLADRQEVDAAAERLGTSGAAEEKPWNMYEFAASDPDETLVRIGCPRHAGAGAGARVPAQRAV